MGGWDGLGDRPASPFPPVVFWLLASSLARRPTEACLPEGQGGGNSWRKSATQERRRDISCTAGPGRNDRGWTGWSGRLESAGQQPENAVRQTGPGLAGVLRRTALDPTAGRASGRPRPLFEQRRRVTKVPAQSGESATAAGTLVTVMTSGKQKKTGTWPVFFCFLCKGIKGAASSPQRVRSCGVPGRVCSPPGRWVRRR
jgi:hypothetical protein